MLKNSRKILLGMIFSCLILPAQAEIISSSADHYVLKHHVGSPLTPNQLWAKLVNPSTWWHPDHTFSGDSDNLSLDLKAGGHWTEQWGDNHVLHGTVLNVDRGKLLRLDAPFGPLQGMAVKVIWTIKIEPDSNGSIVTFEEIANGVPASKLDELAKAVDYVKSEAISRLAKE